MRAILFASVLLAVGLAGCERREFPHYTIKVYPDVLRVEAHKAEIIAPRAGVSAEEDSAPAARAFQRLVPSGNPNLSQIRCPHCQWIVGEIGRDAGFWWRCSADPTVGHHRADRENAFCKEGTCPKCRERCCVSEAMH